MVSGCTVLPIWSPVSSSDIAPVGPISEIFPKACDWTGTRARPSNWSSISSSAAKRSPSTLLRGSSVSLRRTRNLVPAGTRAAAGAEPAWGAPGAPASRGPKTTPRTSAIGTERGEPSTSK